MTPRRTAEERIAEASAKPQPNGYGVGASAIWIASAGLSGFRGLAVKPIRPSSRTQTRCSGRRELPRSLSLPCGRPELTSSGQRAMVDVAAGGIPVVRATSICFNETGERSRLLPCDRVPRSGPAAKFERPRFATVASRWRMLRSIHPVKRSRGIDNRMTSSFGPPVSGDLPAELARNRRASENGAKSFAVWRGCDRGSTAFRPC